MTLVLFQIGFLTSDSTSYLVSLHIILILFGFLTPDSTSY